MHWLKLYYEKRREGVKKIGGAQNGELPVAMLVVLGGRSYAAAVEGKRHREERKSSNRGTLGSSGIQTKAKMGNPHSLAGDHAEGDGSLKLGLERAKNMQLLKNYLISLKTEAERWLGILEMGSEDKGEGKLEGPGDKMLEKRNGKVVVSAEEIEDSVKDLEASGLEW